MLFRKSFDKLIARDDVSLLEPGENSQNGSGENRQKRVKKKSPMYQKIYENYLLV